jgi:DNA replication protein DnaC
MEQVERTNKLCSLEELLYPQAPASSQSYELTEEEKEAALREAQWKKEKRLKHDEDLAMRKRWETTLTRPWSASEMATYVTWKANQRGIDYKLDDGNKDAFKALCLYFTNNGKFSTAGDGFSLKKGLMLCGTYGTGKTTLMELFRGNQYQSFQVFGCRDIADLFKKDGEGILQQFSRPISVPSSVTTFYQNTIGACFDDLGTEGVKSNFGDKVNVMADVILNRYDKRIPYHFTHITTNLVAEEIESFYGGRVRSRMREMFNMIHLSGEDRRI